MDHEEVTRVLTGAGFSEYEATVYTTLLHVGDVSIAELPELCDIPRTRVYDVVDDLEKRGLVETYEGTPQRVAALEPVSLLDQLAARSKSLTEAASEIQTTWQESGANQLSITVSRKYDQMLAKAAAEFENANNLISVSPRPDDVETLEPSLRAAMERDVTVRITSRIHSRQKRSTSAMSCTPKSQRRSDAVNRSFHLWRWSTGRTPFSRFETPSVRSTACWFATSF